MKACPHKIFCVTAYSSCIRRHQLKTTHCPSVIGKVSKYAVPIQCGKRNKLLIHPAWRHTHSIGGRKACRAGYFQWTGRLWIMHFQPTFLKKQNKSNETHLDGFQGLEINYQKICMRTSGMYWILTMVGSPNWLHWPKSKASCTWESTLFIFREYEIGKPYSDIAYISSLFLPIAADAEPGLLWGEKPGEWCPLS